MFFLFLWDNKNTKSKLFRKLALGLICVKLVTVRTLPCRFVWNFFQKLLFGQVLLGFVFFLKFLNLDEDGDVLSPFPT